MLDPQTQPNSSRTRTGSKVPLPVPTSRFSTYNIPKPTSPSLCTDNPLQGPLFMTSTPSKIPRKPIAASPLSNSHSLSAETSTILTREENQEILSKDNLSVTNQTSYVSADGSHYGPKLSIAKDAPKIIFGSRSNTTSKSKQLTPTPKSVDRMKPLPSPPLVPKPLHVTKQMVQPRNPPHASTATTITTAAAPTFTSHKQCSNDLAQVSEAALELLNRAAAAKSTQVKEQLIVIAQGLVEAIIAAREAEMRVLSSQKAASAASVKAMEAKAACARSQRVAVEMGRRALKGGSVQSRL